MIKEYSFTIETNQSYYNRLLEITQEETIGKMWVIKALARAMVMAFGIFLIVKYAGYQFSLTTTFCIWIVISIYYIFTMYKYSKDLKEEYSIANLSTKPKKITITMSEDDILLNKDSESISITWNDINGFDEKKDGLLIGYLDGQIMMIDTNHLEPEKYHALIDLIKSKLVKNNMDKTSSSFVPLIAAVVTAILGVIIFYAFGYIVYNLFLNPYTLVKMIVAGIFSIVVLIVALSFFYIARREWRSWKELRASNKNEETQ